MNNHIQQRCSFWQRVLCVLLSLVLVVGFIPSNAYATDSTAGGEAGAVTESEQAANAAESAGGSDSADSVDDSSTDGNDAADSTESTGSTENSESISSSKAASESDSGVDSSSTAEIDTESLEGEYASDELIIGYVEDALGLDDELEVDEALVVDEASTTEGNPTLESVGVEIQKVIAEESGSNGEVVLAELSEDASVEELVAELSDDPSIAYVQPNYTYELLETSVNDTYVESQYYLESSGFTTAWDVIKTNNTVSIAVIDTGCSLSHTDLTSNIDTSLAWDVTTNTSLSKSRVANNGDAMGHGTMVCGIISAVANNGVGIAGASYNATIIPVKVYDSAESCSTSDVVSAYSYLDGLIDKGTDGNLRVINMSLGTYEDITDTALETSINNMLSEHDVLTVCAGGNGDGTNAYTANCYPADFDACVSVTSVSKTGANSTFSDYNAEKDISAYGEDIYTTTATGSYGTNSGTSFAAPQVAAAAALMWAVNSDLSAAQVVSILQSTADEITGNTHASLGSAGILDADEAVSIAESYDASTSTYVATPSKASLSSVTLATSLTSATVKWSKISGVTGYRIYRSADGGSSYSKVATVTGASTTSWTDSSLSLGKTYTYKVCAYNTSGITTRTGSFSSTKSVTTKPSTVTISSVTATTTGAVKVTWEKVSNATGYVIYRSTNGGSYSKVKTVTKNTTVTWTDTSVSAGKVYCYKVRAYKTSGSTTAYSESYSAVKKVTAKPAKVTISSAKTTTAGAVKVTWKKVSNATGYVIYRSTNGGRYSKVKTVTKNTTVSWTNKSVSAGKVYRYKIRAYYKSGSTTVYSTSYSAVKKVTAKPAKVTISSVKSTAKRSGTVKWKKVSGATGYQVAYRIKGKSKWYYVTVKSTSKKFTSLRNKNYYVKVRAYKTYNGKKYYGSWSSTKAMKVK